MPARLKITPERATGFAKAFPNELFAEAAKSVRGQKEGDYYPYIQMDQATFLSEVVDKLPSKGRFVDIGCGAGDKLALVHAFRPGLKLTGIELDPRMVLKAKEYCPFASIIEGDALLQDYSKYDVLYAYTPIANKKLWAELVVNILSNMKWKSKFYCNDVAHLDFFRWDATPDKRYVCIHTYTKEY